jgi:hypothetical protein
MTRILVVGSGPSGVHFAQQALSRGHEITLLDVGYPKPEPVAPEATFDGLKTAIADPAEYFLGKEGEGVVYPSGHGSYYGHPPSKNYVFRMPEGFQVRSTSMEALFSFARGGLAEAWTGGSYAFNDIDLADFPFRYAELQPYYAEVARRIGIAAAGDDLARFIPFDAGYLDPLPLDPHSAGLMARYTASRERLNRELGFYLGRSRVAVLSRDHADRRACEQLGRCLWGCPRGSIYTPSATLKECLTLPGFRYVPGVLVSHFEYEPSGRISRMVGSEIQGGATVKFEAERYVLAAGALPTSKIVLDSVFKATGRVESLGGLMDNRQVHIPFFTPAMLGKPVNTASYQYHHLAFGLTRPDPKEYVHAQITTLKSASVHPIVQSLPLDFRAATAIFRALRAGLGIANVNLHDTRRPGSRVTIRPITGTDRTELVLDYVDDPTEQGRMTGAVRQVKGALGQLGCLVPPGMTRVLPKGASVHYSGTLPMTAGPGRFTCDARGRSRDFPNLCIADGAGFPFLPAKNLTFTLMANAARIADRLD